MKLPRDVSGVALIKILERHFGYRQVPQVGSHVVLETNDPHHHRAHASLRLGTLNAVLRTVAQAKHINKNDILANL